MSVVAVPPCPKCGKPLGLYYMDCLWCYGHAGDFTYSDYAAAANASQPASEEPS